MSQAGPPSRPLRHGAVAAVVAAPLTWYVFELFSGDVDTSPFEDLFEVLLPGVIVSGATMLLLGAPWVWLLRKRGWLTVLNVCAGATACGVAAFSILAAIFGSAPSLPMLATAAAIGLSSGVAFCVVSGVRPWRPRY